MPYIPEKDLEKEELRWKLKECEKLVQISNSTASVLRKKGIELLKALYETQAKEPGVLQLEIDIRSDFFEDLELIYSGTKEEPAGVICHAWRTLSAMYFRIQLADKNITHENLIRYRNGFYKSAITFLELALPDIK